MNHLQRVLTMKGYAVRKDSLTEEKQREIRRELTVTPVTQSKFGGGAAAAPFAVYYESQQRFYLPRHWAIPLYGPPEADILPEGEALPSSVTFTGKPFDYQLGIIQQFLDAGSNGLICVPCGKGKTFMALCIAARLGKRFLIVVDKEFLLNQWKGEMEQFFPGLRVGVLRGTKCETDHTQFDVTLCMIQSLVQKEYPDDTFKSYGFAIFDECHHLGAAQFSRALLKIQTKYMLGLSATPTRDDGLTKVFEWYLGKPVYWEKTREPDTTVVVKAMYFESDKGEYNNVPTNQYGETISAKLLGQVMDFEPRNQWIAETICKLTDEPTRRILILSQYKRHLNAFEEILKVKRPQVTYSYYVGQMKEHIREEGAKTAQVLLGSYAMASEAMNIKTLNTIVLASPRKKIEQSVGRILRQRPSERSVHPLIVDIIDSHGTFRRQFTKRRAFYTQCGYKIERIFLKKQDTQKTLTNEIDDSGGSESVGNSTDSEEDEVVPVYKKEVPSEYAFVDDS